jgi:HK97 family phage major capsid protein
VPPIVSTDFDGVTTPPAVQALVVNQLLGGSPFARSLNPLVTAAGSVSWPQASPTGGNWVGEGQPLPAVDLAPDALTVFVRKLAGTFSVSNESVNDSTFSIADAVGQVVADSLGPVLDAGVLSGDGVAPNPAGVLGAAPVVADGPLWPGVFAAQGAIGDAGGVASHVGLKPSTLATEAARVDSNDRPLYPEGLTSIGGMAIVGVPTLAADQVLVYDAVTMRLIVRNDFAFEVSPFPEFTSDLTTARVKGRFSVSWPSGPNKSMRAFKILAIGP